MEKAEKPEQLREAPSEVYRTLADSVAEIEDYRRHYPTDPETDRRDHLDMGITHIEQTGGAVGRVTGKLSGIEVVPAEADELERAS